MASPLIPNDAIFRAKEATGGLMLNKLKIIVRQERLPVSGAKAALQERIKSKLDEYVRNGDVNGFNRLRSLISNPDQASAQTSYGSGGQTTHTTTQQPSRMGGGPERSPASFGAVTSAPYPPVRPNFKDSPFFSILTSLTPTLECKGTGASHAIREQTRDSLDCKIKLPPELAEKFSRDSPTRENLKVMIYCAAEPISVYNKVDISFPTQIEIKVNGNEVRANLRGLKNKPGSTRPADITDLVHKRTNYENLLTVTYALTSKKYYLIVNLVQQAQPETLVESLKNGKIVSKDQVIKEMRSKSKDTDIEATSSIMSLKCPLSTLRMDIPCRSVICTHNQCFDALSFLQLQEQAPTWTCPVCNKAVTFDGLQVDEYVDDILKTTPKSVEQVTVGPDGTWSPVHSAENSSKFINGQRASSDEDDLVEIQEPRRLTAIRAGVISTPSSMTRTPPQSSREQSIVSATARSSGGKRPHAVIDLTLSSDDEEQPRAPKRPNLQASLAYPNSFGSQGTPASGSSLRHNSQNFGFSVHGSSGSSSSDHLFGR